MNYLNGGYVMIKHNATQKDLAAAYKSNRPVLVYDENQKAHWAQINETVTTETVDDEVVTTYTYSYQLLNDIESLVDSAGNPRFIEGDGTPLEKEGLNVTYCKWSLSGSHLMLVCAGTVANGTTLSNIEDTFTFNLPEWIMNKIYPVFATYYIEVKTITFWGDDWTNQNISFNFVKRESIIIRPSGNLTLTKDRGFRIQFDLLIDADYE